jgi:hypothetical protein
MKIKNASLLFLFVSIFSFGMTESTAKIDTTTSDTTVYVCGKSKIYHNSRSHGALDKCKSGIFEITAAKAKGLGKRACKCKY